MRLVYHPSVDDDDLDCDDLIDKDNGNITVASDVHEDYQDLFENAPQLLEGCLSLLRFMAGYHWIHSDGPPDPKCCSICRTVFKAMGKKEKDDMTQDFVFPAVSLVRCFRRRGELDEEMLKRHALWVMTRESGYRGIFFHGSRDEHQPPRYSIEDLKRWCSPGGFLDLIEITPDEALAVLEGWPEAQRDLCRIFDRHGMQKRYTPLEG